MANQRAANVLVVTENERCLDVAFVDYIKLVAPDADSMLTIKDGDQNGTQVWCISAKAGTATLDDTELRFSQGCYVTITGAGAKSYIVYSPP